MSEPSGAPAWRGYLALSLIWLAVLSGTVFITRRPSGEPIEIAPAPTAAPTATLAPTATPGPLHVDVAGAVVAPGVYRLAPGSIVADAIAIAGGPAPDADLDRINKAVALFDGSQVYVPRIDQTPPPVVEPVQPAAPPASRSSGPGALLVNLNTATAADLESLPGIGEALARRIIEGRPYGAVEDLLRVDGIGEGTLRKLRDHIVVQ